MTSDKEAPVPDHMLLHKDSINRVLNFIHPVHDFGIGALFFCFGDFTRFLCESMERTGIVEYGFALFGVQWVMPKGVVTLCFGQHPNSGI